MLRRGRVLAGATAVSQAPWPSVSWGHREQASLELRPLTPGWRQRDAYSRDEDSGSQLDVLPPCYAGSVTAVTDAFQRLFQPFQADKWTGNEQFLQGASVGQSQFGRGQFRQGIEDKGAGLHMVMRDF